MKNRKKQLIFLVILVVLLIVVNYSLMDNLLTKTFMDHDMGLVERVIDGDTLVINGTSIRLLGINCPEKGEEYSDEAQAFLEMIVLNKTVELKYGKDKYDRYGRTLAYIFYNGKNVNLELVDEGLANFYFFDHNKYYDDFKGTWENCVRMNKNLCEKSVDVCADCIKLKEFNHKKQIVVFENKCHFYCDLESWDVKDEGRKHFEFPEFNLKANGEVSLIVKEGIDTNERLFWTGEDYVWTDTGDTLFLRDAVGRLVLWESY